MRALCKRKSILLHKKKNGGVIVPPAWYSRDRKYNRLLSENCNYIVHLIRIKIS